MYIHIHTYTHIHACIHIICMRANAHMRVLTLRYGSANTSNIMANRKDPNQNPNSLAPRPGPGYLHQSVFTFSLSWYELDTLANSQPRQDTEIHDVRSGSRLFASNVGLRFLIKCYLRKYTVCFLVKAC